jgi:hypothetical protein
LGDARDGVSTHVVKPEKALGLLPDGLTDVDAALTGQPLQAVSQVGGEALRGVIHPQVVADLTHDHQARMQADPQRHADAMQTP